MAFRSRSPGATLGDVVDTEFISIQTHAGDLDFELRTEHNGYYCGYITFVEKKKVWPVFDEIREKYPCKHCNPKYSLEKLPKTYLLLLSILHNLKH